MGLSGQGDRHRGLASFSLPHVSAGLRQDSHQEGSMFLTPVLLRGPGASEARGRLLGLRS